MGGHLGHERVLRRDKAFHNALQGQGIPLTPAMQATYLDTVQANAARLDFGSGIVVIHDPQPAALVLKRSGRPLDLALPHRPVAPRP